MDSIKLLFTLISTAFFSVSLFTNGQVNPQKLLEQQKIMEELYTKHQNQHISSMAKAFLEDGMPKVARELLLYPGEALNSSKQVWIVEQLCKLLQIQSSNCTLDDIESSAFHFLTLINITESCASELAYGFLGSLLTKRNVTNFSWESMSDVSSAKQLDAFGKPSPGFFVGNYFWVGNYEECIGIDTTIAAALPSAAQPSVINYQGKYCTVGLNSTVLLAGALGKAFPLALHFCEAIPFNTLTYTTVQWGVCMPNSCSNEDVFTLLYFIMSSGWKRQPAVCGVNCLERPPLKWKTEAIVMLAVLGLIGLFVVVGTIFDYFVYRPAIQDLPESTEEFKYFTDHSKTTVGTGKVLGNFLTSAGIKPTSPTKIWEIPTSSNSTYKFTIMTRDEYYAKQNVFVKIILAFSLYSNGKRILDTRTKPGQVTCVHGIRFISMTWIIMGHSYQQLNQSDNLADVANLKDYFIEQAIINATFSVDTFFLISGLLLAYLWFKEMIRCKGKKLKSPYAWSMYYAHRYIRLTPVYMLLLGVQTVLIRHVTRGPMWFQGGAADYQSCKAHWWTNLLYVNNLVHSEFDHMCHQETWYLANDMQFHVFAPIVLVPLFLFPWAGITLGVLLIMVSMGINAWECAHWRLQPITLWGNPQDPLAPEDAGSKYWKYMYIAPWTRYPPFVIGILFGYWMQVRPKLKIHWVISVVIWCIAAASCSAVIFGLIRYEQGTLLPVWQRALYSAVCRPVWSLGVAWVIMACFTGNGEPVNEFLSWPGWTPLSRMTYCAYLTHIAMEYILLTGFDTLPHWTNHMNWQFTRYVPLLALSYTVAFFATTILELPVLALEKILIDAAKKQKPSQNENQPFKEQNATSESGNEEEIGAASITDHKINSTQTVNVVGSWDMFPRNGKMSEFNSAFRNDDR